MSLTAKQPVAALSSITDANTRQVRTRVVVDGRVEVITERVPHGKYMKVVKPSGAVARIPLYNGRANTASDDPYALFMRNRKLAIGCVPYDRCLQTLDPEFTSGFLDAKWFGSGYPAVPEHLRNRQPCRLAADGQPIGISHACKCVEELIAYRKQQQVDRMAKVEIKNAAQEAASAQASAAKEMAEAAKSMADTAKSLGGKRTPADGGAK